MLGDQCRCWLLFVAVVGGHWLLCGTVVVACSLSLHVSLLCCGSLLFVVIVVDCCHATVVDLLPILLLSILML